MVGVEFVADRETKEPDRSTLGTLIGEAMQHGVVAVSCGMYHNVLRHLMPLVITDAELEEGLDVLAEAAVRASKHSGSPDQGSASASSSEDVEGE